MNNESPLDVDMLTNDAGTVTAEQAEQIIQAKSPRPTIEPTSMTMKQKLDRARMLQPVKVQKTGTITKVGPTVRRNDPCPCGSKKKYKHCHGKAG